MELNGGLLGRAIARAIRMARTECGWPQEELAQRLQTNQTKIWRLESGDAKYVDVELAGRALTLLGVRVRFDTGTLGLAGRREQRDVVHAACASWVMRRLTRAGFIVRLEVEVGKDRYRGWIDLLAYRPSDGALLIVEIKTEIRDVGAIQRTVSWYQREAWAAARTFGWVPNQSTIALVLLESVENDARVAANRSALRLMFPASAGDLASWIEGETDEVPRGFIAMVDPRSRRRSWLLATRSDGRRTPAPYADYRDAAQRLSRR